MRRFAVCLILVSLCTTPVLAEAEAAASSAGLVLKVTDQAGKPVPQAEVMAYKRERPTEALKVKCTDKEGNVTFGPSDYMWSSIGKIPAAKYRVAVLARGMAPAFAEADVPTTTPLLVRMQRGTPVRLQILGADGKPMPGDSIPRVFPRKFVFSAWPSNLDHAVTATSIRRIEKGTFECSVDSSTTEAWCILVHDPAICRGYLADLQTTAIKNGALPAIRLPATGAVQAELQFPEKYADKSKGNKTNFELMTVIDAGEKSEMYVGVSSAKPTGQPTAKVTMTKVPADSYYLSIESAPADGNRMGEDGFSSGTEVTVRANETTAVVSIYKEYDPSKARGPATAHVQVHKMDGSPAAGMKVVLKILDPEFSIQHVTSGTLDAAGEATFTQLSNNAPSRDGTTTAPRFRLMEDNGTRWGGMTIGSVRFDTPETSRTFQFTMPPREGDLAPDVTLIDPYTSQTVKLSDFRDQVVFMDFWATWCGPCQEPMAHNQKVMSEKADAWKGKAVIMGASIDDDPDTLKNHVKKNGWEKVRQLWCGDGAFKSKPAAAYTVDGVPTALLIDQQGKIVWRGHPSGFEIEEQVEKLLNAVDKPHI